MPSSPTQAYTSFQTLAPHEPVLRGPLFDPWAVLNNNVRILENLGIGRAATRRHAEDTALAMATYSQQDEDR